MLINRYLEMVLGSKVKVKILRVLLTYPTKKFTLRELARSCSTVHSPVQRALSDLQEMNLISRERVGTANVIIFNTKSYLFQPLQTLFQWEAQTKRHLGKELQSLIPPVKMAVLFGSIQHGDEKPTSDIDILVVADSKKAVEKRLEEDRLRIIKQFGNRLEAHLFTEKELKRKMNAPFVRELLKDYTLLKGKDLIKKWWKHDKNTKRR